MYKLSARQQRFIKHYVRLGNASHAAREAGYAKTGARVTACRLLANPNVQEAVSAERRRYERELKVTREQVIAELRSAIDIARTQSNASAMISGWREIAKICGYYDRKVEVSIHPNVAAQRLISQLEIMSTEELLKLTESSTN